MLARWMSFAVGLWLIFAPLLLGYALVALILHDVALGLLVCTATLAALERPVLRFSLTLPALWLLCVPKFMGWTSFAASATEISAGAVLLVLALVPSAKLASARAAARMMA